MKRWPLVRHVRYFVHVYRMNKHYDFWRSLGYLPVNIEHDEKILQDIWDGKL
jgi:hypothetical protein